MKSESFKLTLAVIYNSTMKTSSFITVKVPIEETTIEYIQNRLHPDWKVREILDSIWITIKPVMENHSIDYDYTYTDHIESCIKRISERMGKIMGNVIFRELKTRKDINKIVALEELFYDDNAFLTWNGYTIQLKDLLRKGDE